MLRAAPYLFRLEQKVADISQNRLTPLDNLYPADFHSNSRNEF